MTNLLLIALLALTCPILQADDNTDALQTAIAGKHRSAEHKNRDKYRHPKQTLEFFDVKNTMTVVEIWPSEGWYTEILALYLKNKGKLIAAHFSKDAKEPYYRKKLNSFIKKMQRQPKIYGKVELTELQPPTLMNLAPEGSADRILTFRNIGSWMKHGQAAAVFNAMYKALKPGGILGVVEHRNLTLKPQDPKAGSGYITEDYVIALARNAGFEFLAKSEINANKKDTKDYPEGVRTLPPTLILGKKNRKKFLAIGESDRMTIKFIKPK